MACTYSCLFGISDSISIDTIKTTPSFKVYKDHRSYLFQAAPDGKMWWFAFVKNDTKTIGPDMPRYTDDDEKALVEKIADDVLCEGGLTFGDVHRKRLYSVLVPLEEYVLERCFCKRVVLLGDSFHKVDIYLNTRSTHSLTIQMHPIYGQGGNAVIESAAQLANLLLELVQRDALDDESIQRAFTEYQLARKPRAERLIELSHDIQRLEALDSPLHRFIGLNVLSKLDLGPVVPRIAETVMLGGGLRYLPAPKRRGIVAWADELKMAPEKRSFAATVCWIRLILLAASAPVILRRCAPAVELDTGPAGSSLPQLYATISALAIHGLWVIESYRRSFFLSPVGR